MNVEELKAKMEASGIEDVKVDTETGEVKKVYEAKPVEINLNYRDKMYKTGTKTQFFKSKPSFLARSCLRRAKKWRKPTQFEVNPLSESLFPSRHTLRIQERSVSFGPILDPCKSLVPILSALAVILALVSFQLTFHHRFFLFLGTSPPPPGGSHTAPGPTT